MRNRTYPSNNNTTLKKRDTPSRIKAMMKSQRAHTLTILRRKSTMEPSITPNTTKNMIKPTELKTNTTTTTATTTIRAIKKPAMTPITINTMAISIPTQSRPMRTNKIQTGYGTSTLRSGNIKLVMVRTIIITIKNMPSIKKRIKTTIRKSTRVSIRATTITRNSLRRNSKLRHLMTTNKRLRSIRPRIKILSQRLPKTMATSSISIMGHKRRIKHRHKTITIIITLIIITRGTISSSRTPRFLTLTLNSFKQVTRVSTTC